MNKKKWIKLGLTVLLAFSLTACGTKDSGNADQSNSAVTMTAGSRKCPGGTFYV